MLDETRTNGTNGSHGVLGYELPYAEAADAPHPHHAITGDAPSAMFLDRFTGAWVDREVTLLRDVPAGDLALLQRLGIITTPAGTPGTSTFRMRLSGRLVLPRNIASRRARSVPIVFIVMGNHLHIDIREFRRGVLVERHSHNGYDYLQQALADLGIASCSVDTNFANGLNLGIRSRAEILLATMARTAASAPSRDKLDFGNVGLVGHSRGGDAVVLGALLARARSLPFNVKCVTSLAPTDFTALTTGRIDGRVNAPMSLGGAVRYLVLLGSHDGDVAEPQRNGFSLYDRATCDKTLVFARGLTHNRFNTIWNECKDYADGRHIFVDDDDCMQRSGTAFDRRIFAAVVHREYAKFFGCALARRTLLNDASAEDILRGLVAPSRTLLQQSPGLAGPAASVQWSVASALSVDEFDAGAVGRRTPTPTAAVQSAASGRPSVPHLTRAFVASSAGNNVRIDLGNRDLSSRRELTFRLTSMIPIASERAIDAARSPDWEVRLVTSRGASACRPSHVDRRGLREPNKPFFHTVFEEGDGDPATRPPPINVTKNQYDTLSIPLTAFANADLRDVRALEFEARSGELPIIVDSFAFV